MNLIKRFFQHAQPTQQAATLSQQEHPNFWMYQ